MNQHHHVQILAVSLIFLIKNFFLFFSQEGSSSTQMDIGTISPQKIPKMEFEDEELLRERLLERKKLKQGQ